MMVGSGLQIQDWGQNENIVMSLWVAYSKNQ
jgi:hypothetical protein